MLSNYEQSSVIIINFYNDQFTISHIHRDRRVIMYYYITTNILFLNVRD